MAAALLFMTLRCSDRPHVEQRREKAGTSEAQTFPSETVCGLFGFLLFVFCLYDPLFLPSSPVSEISMIGKQVLMSQHFSALVKSRWATPVDS